MKACRWVSSHRAEEAEEEWRWGSGRERML